MKKFFSVIRKFWLLILGGIILWLMFVFYRPFEPHYQGKPLSAWATYVFSSGLARQNAVEAIQHIGTNALPYAIKFCSTKDFAWKLNIFDWIVQRRSRGETFDEIGFNGYGKLEAIIPTAQDTRNRGVGIFEALGPMAKPAIPDLIKLLADKNNGVANAAANGLMNIGNDTIPPLIDELTNQNQAVQFYASFTLRHLKDTTGDFKTAIRPAIPILVAQLNDENPFMRREAANALGKFQVDAPIAVPALIEALKRETNFNRQVFDKQSSDFFEDSWKYMDALGSFHTNAQSAVPYLIDTMKSDPSPLARQALNTLGQIAPEIAEPYIQKFNVALTNRVPDDSISNLFYNFYGQNEPPSNLEQRMSSAMQTTH